MAFCCRKSLRHSCGVSTSFVFRIIAHLHGGAFCVIRFRFRFRLREVVKFTTAVQVSAPHVVGDVRARGVEQRADEFVVEVLLDLHPQGIIDQGPYGHKVVCGELRPVDAAPSRVSQRPALLGLSEPGYQPA